MTCIVAFHWTRNSDWTEHLTTSKETKVQSLEEKIENLTDERSSLEEVMEVMRNKLMSCPCSVKVRFDHLGSLSGDMTGCKISIHGCRVLWHILVALQMTRLAGPSNSSDCGLCGSSVLRCR